MAPDPLDFLVFAIQGGGRTIVMDTLGSIRSRRSGAGAKLLCNAGRGAAQRRDRCRGWCAT